MISAKEARAISGPTVDEQVKDALQYAAGVIQKSAERGNRQVKISHKPHCDWAYSGYKCEASKKFKEAVELLGYELDIYYREGQFVDYAMIIKW